MMLWYRYFLLQILQKIKRVTYSPTTQYQSCYHIMRPFSKLSYNLFHAHNPSLFPHRFLMRSLVPLKLNIPQDAISKHCLVYCIWSKYFDVASWLKRNNIDSQTWISEALKLFSWLLHQHWGPISWTIFELVEILWKFLFVWFRLVI